MSKKVLVVDDASFMRKMLSDILEKNGYEVVGDAQNGIEAVEKYKELRPDLVTMDITMPEMDGLEALSEIIRYDEDAVVVMCSAMGQQKMVMDSINAGAKEFIVKPFRPDQIKDTLSKLF